MKKLRNADKRPISVQAGQLLPSLQSFAHSSLWVNMELTTPWVGILSSLSQHAFHWVTLSLPTSSGCGLESHGIWMQSAISSLREDWKSCIRRNTSTEPTMRHFMTPSSKLRTNYSREKTDWLIMFNTLLRKFKWFCESIEPSNQLRVSVSQSSPSFKPIKHEV